MRGTIIKRLYVLLCAILLHTHVFAQQYSYVYIQGDKLLPFYVKLGDEMLPRYGKNYCILPRLEAGEITIEVLFQQNKYPSEHFTIRVPESSSRNFLLTKKDAIYCLYDLQQGFYLYNGNTASDDHLPTILATIPSQNIDSPAMAVAPPLQNETPTVTKKKKEPLLRREKKSPARTDNAPAFIDNIELGNQHPIGTTATKTQNEPANESSVAIASTAIPAAIPNSDCVTPISSDDLELIYKKTMAEESEESRLGYLLQQADHCFTTTQLRLLTRSLDTDSARFAFLKKLYAHTTDQAAFPALEDLFVSEDWKNYFKQLTNK